MPQARNHVGCRYAGAISYSRFLSNEQRAFFSVAAYIILTRDKSFTGNFVIDEAILREEGCKDFDQYAVAPGHELLPDGFIDDVDENVFSLATGSSKASSGEKATSSGGGAGGVANVFKDVKGILNEDLVKKVNAVYAFDVQGKPAVLRLRRI